MARAITDEIQADVRELITHITHLEDTSERFAVLEKCVLTTLKKSDTMYFLNTKDIKTEISSMADKFMFHGFFKHAEYLKQTHDKYIDKNLSESDLTPRLNIVKFLLCMSQSPTTHFWKNPEKFEFIKENDTEDEVVDWGAYLNEGIDLWSPTHDDSFNEHSDSDEETLKSQDCQAPTGSSTRIVIKENKKIEKYDFRESRTQLTNLVQNGWFNGEVAFEKPPSEWFEANVGILWHQHLQNQVKHLIVFDPLSVISEYKVMREILWQMWGPHTSTVFQLSVDKLVPKLNVTIASVRSGTFESFMSVFIPYIELLDDFRQFTRILNAPDVPETYKSYACAIHKILNSLMFKLVEVEEEVRLQETTMTLLKLAQKFEELFKPIKVLKNVHDEVIMGDFREKPAMESALTLLVRLRRSLDFSLNKLDQDIRLALYLESLFYYLTMTNAWFVKNDLFDHTKEFIILNNNTRPLSMSTDPQMNFTLQPNIAEFCDQDGIIKIIADQVLQIGRNIHLLRLLKKYDVFTKGPETIYQEFVRKILEELCQYYEQPIPTVTPKESKVRKVVSTFDMNEMGDWTNFVDLSDGFLAKAFEGFQYEKVDDEEKEESLFEKIHKITTNLFPLQNLFERVLTQILKERFTISGLMVKNLLIENYNLDKQFEFLNHMFLFWDDLIFPFYKKLFKKMNTANSNWGNSVWLTSHLQDIIMDAYPNFYEDCTVQVKEFWKECRDSLEACTIISLQYEIKWPLSIIITDEHIVMYKEVFQFILKLKWALYTVNQLFFTDLEPKNKAAKPRASKLIIKRLKYLRFNLINILNKIQHYIFGFIFTKNRLQFELDFEKSNDLKSLITAHESFIKSVHRSVVEMRDKTSNLHGFNTMLKCVKMLKVMWNGLQYATGENLDNCYRIYCESFDVVNVIVNPVVLFDY